MLGTHATVTVEGRTYVVRTRTDRPNLEGKGTAVRMGKWLTAYVAACTAGAGKVGDRQIRCLLTGRMFDAWSEGDVDRLIPSKGYVMGNVCLVSQRGNWGRGLAQKLEGDIAGIDAYIALVRNATKGMPHFSPTSADIKALYQHANRSDRNSRQSSEFAGENERIKAMMEVQEYIHKNY